MSVRRPLIEKAFQHEAIAACFNIDTPTAKHLIETAAIQWPCNWASVATIQELAHVQAFLGRVFAQIEHEKRKRNIANA